MLYDNEPRDCLACGEQIKGRIDKKFCDDHCRNSYHNYCKRNISQHVRNVNNALAKNRRVLAMLLNDKVKSMKIPKAKLQLMGLHFTYCTQRVVDKSGKIRSYCYEYSYESLDNDWCLISRINEADLFLL